MCKPSSWVLQRCRHRLITRQGCLQWEMTSCIWWKCLLWESSVLLFTIESQRKSVYGLKSHQEALLPGWVCAGLQNGQWPGQAMGSAMWAPYCAAWPLHLNTTVYSWQTQALEAWGTLLTWCRWVVSLESKRPPYCTGQFTCNSPAIHLQVLEGQVLKTPDLPAFMIGRIETWICHPPCPPTTAGHDVELCFSMKPREKFSSHCLISAAATVYKHKHCPPEVPILPTKVSSRSPVTKRAWMAHGEALT